MTPDPTDRLAYTITPHRVKAELRPAFWGNGRSWRQPVEEALEAQLPYQDKATGLFWTDDDITASNKNGLAGGEGYHAFTAHVNAPWPTAKLSNLRMRGSVLDVELHEDQALVARINGDAAAHSADRRLKLPWELFG